MLLIGNGNVLTRDASAPWIRDGAVVTEGEKILETGSFAQMKEK